MKELKKYEELAIKASLVAGNILKKHFNTLKHFEIKRNAGIVTKADTDAEEALNQFFNTNTPGFGVLGEEKGLN